jgi:hypothetical protein
MPHIAVTPVIDSNKIFATNLQTHSMHHAQSRTGYVVLTPLHTYISTLGLTAYVYNKKYSIFFPEIIGILFI